MSQEECVVDGTICLLYKLLLIKNLFLSWLPLFPSSPTRKHLEIKLESPSLERVIFIPKG